ncbi:MAG: hypothetical protein A2Y76_10245 [Planctomycetes bacterium RBG_13_60_9]|nr:MAG: hypothetical protein A2Y76_10245 [Planctomycetes bacterium RBG_13_60_9]
MQTHEAAKRREEWGEKPCSHDHIEKEYYLGAHTGDYVCTTCGQDFSSTEKARLDQEKQRTPQDQAGCGEDSCMG